MTAHSSIPASLRPSPRAVSSTAPAYVDLTGHHQGRSGGALLGILDAHFPMSWRIAETMPLEARLSLGVTRTWSGGGQPRRSEQHGPDRHRVAWADVGQGIDELMAEDEER